MKVVRTVLRRRGGRETTLLSGGATCGITYILRETKTMKQSTIFAALIYVTVASNASASLIAEYQFSGNANDTSGNGHNGIVVGANLGLGHRFDHYHTPL